VPKTVMEKETNKLLNAHTDMWFIS